jgi:hypothetical protein
MTKNVVGSDVRCTCKTRLRWGQHTGTIGSHEHQPHQAHMTRNKRQSVDLRALKHGIRWS